MRDHETESRGTEVGRIGSEELALSDVLRPLLGKSVWGVSVGGQLEEWLFLEIGAVLPRAEPKRNAELDPLVRANDGEFTLFVRGDWRLIRNDRVVASCGDDYELAGPMATTVRSLTGTLIAAIDTNQPGNLTRVHFDDGSTLEIIPTQLGDSGYYDFSLRHLEISFIVRADGIDTSTWTRNVS